MWHQCLYGVMLGHGPGLRRPPEHVSQDCVPNLAGSVSMEGLFRDLDPKLVRVKSCRHPRDLPPGHVGAMRGSGCTCSHAAQKQAVGQVPGLPAMEPLFLARRQEGQDWRVLYLQDLRCLGCFQDGLEEETFGLGSHLGVGLVKLMGSGGSCRTLTRGLQARPAGHGHLELRVANP